MFPANSNYSGDSVKLQPKLEKEMEEKDTEACKVF